MSQDIELLKIHLDTIKSSIDKLDNNVSRLFEKQDATNVLLSNNTVVLTQHHERSVKLEDIQINLNTALTEALKEMCLLKLEVSRIDGDIQPIKRHVASIDKTFSIFKIIPTWVKVVSSIIVAFSSILGAYYTYTQLSGK